LHQTVLFVLFDELEEETKKNSSQINFEKLNFDVQSFCRTLVRWFSNDFSLSLSFFRFYFNCLFQLLTFSFFDKNKIKHLFLLERVIVISVYIKRTKFDKHKQQ